MTAPFVDDYLDEAGLVYWRSLLHVGKTVVSEVAALVALLRGRV